MFYLNKKFNYFSPSLYLKNDCSINYKLSIIKYSDLLICCEKYNLLINNDMIKVDYSNVLKEHIESQKINFNDIDLDNIKKIIHEGKYILLIFDSFYCPQHQYFDKLHNYLTLIIYGYYDDSIFCYMNLGFEGSKKMKYNYAEMDKFLIRNNKYSELNITPCLIWNRKRKYKVKKENILRSIESYYFESRANYGINIFENLNEIIIKNLSNDNFIYNILSIFKLLLQVKEIQMLQLKYLKEFSIINYLILENQKLNLCKVEFIKLLINGKELNLHKIHGLLIEVKKIEYTIKLILLSRKEK